MAQAQRLKLTAEAGEIRARTILDSISLSPLPPRPEISQDLIAEYGMGEVAYHFILSMIERGEAPKHADLLERYLAVVWSEGKTDTHIQAGMLFYQGDGLPQNKSIALKFWLRAAEAGHRTSQYTVGCMLRTGDGVPRDVKAALLWYEAAANQDHELAQRTLGILHNTGDGTPLNHVKAAFWFGRAGKLGDKPSEYNLAIMRMQGVGVPFDGKRGLEMMKKLASSGFEPAVKMLEELNSSPR